MRILLTGANGYIGSRLLPLLVEAGHQVVALVRSASRLNLPEHLKGSFAVLEGDLLDPSSLKKIPRDIDAAYYLVHSMGRQAVGFSDDEAHSAEHFLRAISKTSCKQIIYLGGLAHGEKLSEHMASRKHVEEILASGEIPVTVLRAGIIIGSGSASFEIIRDLVEKLPLMVAPKWVRSRCQPIAITDVLFYLKEVLGRENCLGKTLEIGGPEKLTYHQMLMGYAAERKLRRWIIPVPVLTPRLSSYWLFFITTTSFPLAMALVDSLKGDSICEDETIQQLVPHTCLSYREALKLAFVRIEQNAVISSWSEALVQSRLTPDLVPYIRVPTHGCLKEIVTEPYSERNAALDRLWKIGGQTGWYVMNWAWKLRGAIDRAVGGVGLRRGRLHPTELHNGTVIDFWRVLLAERERGYLLLYAEMRLPGEAWLEYRIDEGTVTQTATFRPRGLLGRLYWYALYPFHHFIFHKLCRIIAQGEK